MNNVVNDYTNDLIHQGLLNRQNNITECKKDLIEMVENGALAETVLEQQEIINKFLNKWENTQTLVDLKRSVMI